MWLPTPRNLAFVRAKRLLDRVVLGLITARRKATSRPDDLLSLLLAAQDEETGVGMTDQQVKDEALTLLTAGHETAGAWAGDLGQADQIQQVPSKGRRIKEALDPRGVPHQPARLAEPC